MTREEAIEVLKKIQRGMIAPSEHTDAIDMAIEDIERWRTWSHTYDNLISRQDAIDAIRKSVSKSETEDSLCYNLGLGVAEEVVNSLPSAEPKTDEENELKFYYVESIDDYWVGRRLDNFYYAHWHEGLGFIWSHSRYLPWGEHIVDENTLWKEHTYPSEPIEIPFTEWIVGFVKKYFAEPKTGKWVKVIDEDTSNVVKWHYECDQCGAGRWKNDQRYCNRCGARMLGEDGE